MFPSCGYLHGLRSPYTSIFTRAASGRSCKEWLGASLHKGFLVGFFWVQRMQRDGMLKWTCWPSLLKSLAIILTYSDHGSNRDSIVWFDQAPDLNSLWEDSVVSPNCAPQIVLSGLCWGFPEPSIQICQVMIWQLDLDTSPNAIWHNHLGALWSTLQSFSGFNVTL